MPKNQENANELPQRLESLRENLLYLHKTLIDFEKSTYERTFGAIESQNRFLQLLIQDPWFAWLHPLSELVVRIDELLDSDEPLTPALVGQVMSQTQGLLKASEEGHGFPRSYFDALQQEPDVVMAHAGVVKCLKSR